MKIVWAPIDRWPREQTKNRAYSPFRSPGSYRYGADRNIGWTTTQPEFERELRQLKVREVVVQLALRDRDIRLDGQVRADAKPDHPGVIVSFTHPHQGPVSFACDKFTTWQANIRGITKALEALRLVDRYGITSSGEQYAGWKEIGAGTPMGETAEAPKMTVEQAARVLVGWVSGSHDLEQNAREAIQDENYRKWAYRKAVAAVHPDAGGSHEAFIRLEAAKTVLEELA